MSHEKLASQPASSQYFLDSAHFDYSRELIDRPRGGIIVVVNATERIE